MTLQATNDSQVSQRLLPVVSTAGVNPNLGSPRGTGSRGVPGGEVREYIDAVEVSANETERPSENLLLRPRRMDAGLDSAFGQTRRNFDNRQEEAFSRQRFRPLAANAGDVSEVYERNGISPFLPHFLGNTLDLVG